MDHGGAAGSRNAVYEVEGSDVETTGATEAAAAAVNCASISASGEAMPGTVDPTTLLPDWFGPDQEDKEQRRGVERSEASLAVTTEEWPAVGHLRVEV